MNIIFPSVDKLLAAKIKIIHSDDLLEQRFSKLPIKEQFLSFHRYLTSLEVTVIS
jgi:hypothetical protein